MDAWTLMIPGEDGVEERKCKNCRFWVQQAEEDITGQCRRFPPTLSKTAPQQEAMEATGAGTFVGVWPDTLGVDWCGEFQRREETPSEKTLEALGLTTQTLNLLTRAGIRTVSDLTARTAADLRRIGKFGEARLREVQTKLAANRKA
jgi:hypothetical protein